MKLGTAVLYTALALAANGALADMSAFEALREGSMRKLTFHSESKDVPLDATFTAEDGSSMTLSDYSGKIVVLNFWATWCAPCRKEMPMLSNLASGTPDEEVAVVTLATGRNSPEGMQRFFDEISVDNLPLHRDPKQAVARQMAILGLPITVILDRDGKEIARLRGDAEWDSDSAFAIVNALAAAK
ncbi:MAG: TlpA disulfide reductase family protein [Pseudomonadota bacterium]